MARNVAGEASSGILRRLSVKPENEFLRRRNLLIVARGGFDRLNVSLAWTMAAFAACAIFHILGRRLGVNGFIKNFRMDRMTGRASLRTRIIARLSLSGHLPDNRRRRVRSRLLLS